jgi:hypothetical protein
MPIHLSPISRRQFLSRTLFAGGALALAPVARAARAPAANTFALLADTHIAADPAKVSRDVIMAENLRNVSRELIAARRPVAGMFIVGDCALGDGQLGDYRTLVELLRPLRAAGMPIHLALGNHDDRGNFRQVVLPTGAPDVADHHVSLVRSPRANWFVLDSLEKTLQTPGRLGAAQLDWLARQLDANADRPALIVAHHNPHADGTIVGLKDTEEFWSVIRPRRHVKAFIYGHTHDWKVTQDASGIHLINLPPVAYVFKEGKPSGWVEAELERSGMSLELRCVPATHPDQGQRLRLKWRR